MLPERHFVLIVQRSSYPQMGALYLTDALAKRGFKTHVLGSEASIEELDAVIERYDPVAVGCSVMTAPEIVDFVRLSSHVQDKYNRNGARLPVIWGGMHATIVWEQTVREPYIDLVVSGEAELTLPRILSELIGKNRLPEGKLVAVDTPADLDEFRPDWEAVDLKRFVFPESHSVHADVSFGKKSIFYYLLSSRGCTYRCNFCWEVARTASLKQEMSQAGTTADLTWRAHSVSWIESQLDYLERRLRAGGGEGMDGVGFWDDMIFGRGREEHLERAKRVFEVLNERRYGYLLEVRANQLIASDDRWNDAGVRREADLYRYLRETGCMQVFVGTESGNQDTLNLIQKGTKLRDYLRLVELSHEVGLPLRFSMIVGFPEETERSVNDTLDLIEKLEDEPYISVSGPKLFTPYPGTPQYQAAVARGMKVPQDTLGWSHLNRYADYRALYPWLEENCSKSTLDRIDSFWEDIPEEKKHRPKEELIQDLVRRH
jgi:anaerobic magnesium-protoporphyrin IX monomethyl ester cyclase